MTQPSRATLDRREAIRRVALLLGGAVSVPTIAGVLAGCDAPPARAEPGQGDRARHLRHPAGRPPARRHAAVPGRFDGCVPPAQGDRAWAV